MAVLFLYLVSRSPGLESFQLRIGEIVQPIVSVAASLLMGIGILKPTHAVAVILVFSGVWLVTKSKSRKDMEKEKEKAVAK